jgi:hypothetical protein
MPLLRTPILSVSFCFQSSNKIYAALLPHIGKLHVVLDSHEALLAIYQLFMTMAPNTVTFPVSHKTSC